MFKLFKKKQTAPKINPIFEKDEEKQKAFINKQSNDYFPEEIEIEALLAKNSRLGGGAHQVVFVSNLMYAYSIDNQLFNENLFLQSYSTAREEAEEIKNRLCKNTIVKLKVRRAKRNVVRQGCLLVDILDTNAQNEQLKELLHDLQKGKTIDDAQLGTLVFNADANGYEGEINWCGDDCSLHVAYRDEAFLQTNLETVYYLVENQQKIKDALIEQVLEFDFPEYSYGKIDKKSLIEDMHVTKIISFWQLEDRCCYVIVTLLKWNPQPFSMGLS